MPRSLAAALGAALLGGLLPVGSVRLEENVSLALQEELEGFMCPLVCAECCQARKWLGTAQDKERFTCLMPTKATQGFSEAMREEKISCDTPTRREKDTSSWESHCEFRKEDKEGYKTLRQCSTDGPRIITYKEFLGASPCSLTGKGDLLNLKVVGTAIDHMYFSVDGVLTGVCPSKFKEFESHGMLDKVCPGKGSKVSEEKNRHSKCIAKVKEDLCNLLQNDLDAKRLDKFAMAAWAAAIGPMEPVTSFPLPEGQPRILKKFTIPGWAARKVAYETLEGDAPIDLAGGAFMCMMTKLQALPVQDDLTDKENNYIDPDEPPVPGQKAFYPQKPRDVLNLYFDRFSAYQTRHHFDIEPQNLQTDDTLMKFVFQAIGAHRLEVVSGEGRLLEPLAPIYFAGALTPTSSPHLERVGSVEGGGEEARRAIRYAVRMEGLFDGVPLRKGMAPWGGNAFFSKSGELVALQYNGETSVSPTFPSSSTDPKHWDAQKFAFRSSLLSTVTAFDHLVGTHILVSETLAIAVSETLPVTHGLRLMLTPHTWATLAINFKAANNLFPAHMLVHRATPFAAEAYSPADGSDGELWKKAVVLRHRPFKEAYATYRRFRDQLLSEGANPPEVPFFEDGILLHTAISQYVHDSVAALYSWTSLTGFADCKLSLAADWDARKFVNRFFELNDEATKDFWPESFRNAAWSCDTLKELLTEVIFLVTGFHRHVGTVPDFLRDTSFAATAWKHGETRGRPKHSMLAELLAATTNARNPKLTTDITGMYKSHRNLYEVAKKFARAMNNLQETIEAKNAKRKSEGNLEFHQMEPKHVEWGVEV